MHYNPQKVRYGFFQKIKENSLIDESLGKVRAVFVLTYYVELALGWVKAQDKLECVFSQKDLFS